MKPETRFPGALTAGLVRALVWSKRVGGVMRQRFLNSLDANIFFLQGTSGNPVWEMLIFVPVRVPRETQFGKYLVLYLSGYHREPSLGNGHFRTCQEVSR